MSRQPEKRPLCWPLRIAGRLLRIALCLLLIVQVVLIAFILANGEVPVPQSVRNALRQPFAKAGYTADWDSLHINLRGQVLINDLKIGIGQGEHNQMLTARSVLVNFNVLGFFAGRFMPQRLMVDEAALLCPAQVSPSGEQEVLLDNLSLDLLHTRQQWQVRQLRAEVLGVRVQAEGEIPQPWLSSIIQEVTGDEEPDAEERPFLISYGEFAHTLLAQEKDLRKLKSPRIHLRFAPWQESLLTGGQTQTAQTAQTAQTNAASAGSAAKGAATGSAIAGTGSHKDDLYAPDDLPSGLLPEENLLLRVTLGAESYRNELIHLEAGRSYLQALLLFDAKGIPTTLTTPYAWAENLRWQDKTSAQRVLVQLPKPDQGHRSLQEALEAPLNTLRLSAWDILAYGFPLEHGQINIVGSGGANGLIDAQDYLVRLSVTNEWDHLSAFAQINRKSRSGWVDFVADWNPAYLGSIPQNDLPDFLRQGVPVHFGQTPHAAGHIVLSDGLRPTWAGLRIRSGSASYKDLVLAYAYVSTHWNGEIVSVDAAIAYSPNGFSAAGSYWQNLKNNQYRIWAEGTIDPTVLNPIIDQGWWTHLWSEFEFKPAHWPWASFSMIGTHNMGTVGKKIYVQAKIDDFGYREIDITSAQGLLYMNGDRVDLYDFSIDTPDGDASLHLQWQWDGPVRHYLAFEASSTLPLADGGMLVGKETAATLSEFKSSLPPRIALVGVLTGDSAADIAEETYVKLDIDFPGTFTYDWLFMDTLSGEITITPKTRELPNLKGVLAGGPVTGSVHIDVLPESALAFKATLDIQDAQLNQLGNALAFLQGPAPELIPFAAPEQPAPTEADFAAIAGAQGPDPQAIAAVAAAGNPQPAQNAQAASSDSSDTANLNVLNLPGLVDFKGTISGISSNLHTFNGEGNLSIEAADLARINLFGGLSGLFRYLGIPIGTLVFNKATTNWDLVNGIVHMPDVRISGNTGLITASGNIDIQDSSINFLLYLQPMGEITTPIISQALSLFSPLANLLSVSISGTLVEPSFKTNVHPVGIFSGRSTVEPHDMVVPPVRPPLKNSGPRKIRRPQHH